MTTLKRWFYRKILRRCEIHKIKLSVESRKPHRGDVDWYCTRCRNFDCAREHNKNIRRLN